MIRKIVHIDMDAFYASVEQRDNPALRGQPIAVGGSSGRGVVMTASYEARRFGVKSAMPAGVASRLCPDLIFVKSRMEAYKEASNAIRAVFYHYTDLVEPLSLDEAYLDVTQDKHEIGSATRVAQAIRRDIFDQTGLTASAGISYNKFLAKIASDMDKPNGQTVILPKHALGVLDGLPIERFHGIGKVTAAKMHEIGVFSGQDLRGVSLVDLGRRFGKAGQYYYHVIRGIDERAVKPNRIRKSIGAETTFEQNKTRYDDLAEKLVEIAHKVEARAIAAQMVGRTLTLKIKFADFEIKTKRLTRDVPIESFEDIESLGLMLLGQINLDIRSVRLLGLSLSNLCASDEQPQTNPQQAFNF